MPEYCSLFQDKTLLLVFSKTSVTPKSGDLINHNGMHFKVDQRLIQDVN
jgi:hypothetical protein